MEKTKRAAKRAALILLGLILSPYLLTAKSDYLNSKLIDAVYTLDVSKATEALAHGASANSKFTGDVYTSADNHVLFRPMYSGPTYVDRVVSIFTFRYRNTSAGTPVIFLTWGGSIPGTMQDRNEYDPRINKIVGILLDHGSDPNAFDAYGQSVLNYAVYAPDPQIVSELIAKHANVNILDRYSVSPLELACRLGDVTIVAELLKSPNATRVKTSNGRPLSDHVLHNSNYGVIVKMLQNAAK